MSLTCLLLERLFKVYTRGLLVFYTLYLFLHLCCVVTVSPLDESFKASRVLLFIGPSGGDTESARAFGGMEEQAICGN